MGTVWFMGGGSLGVPSGGRRAQVGVGAGFDDGADGIDERVPDRARRFAGDVAGGGGGVGGVEAEGGGGHDGGVDVVHHKSHLSQRTSSSTRVRRIMGSW